VFYNNEEMFVIPDCGGTLKILRWIAGAWLRQAQPQVPDNDSFFWLACRKPAAGPPMAESIWRGGAVVSSQEEKD
jgi:hypothetical protein